MFQEATAFYTIAAAGNAAQPIHQPIRLTRRGRVLLRMLLVTVMVAIALALTMAVRAAMTSDAPSGGMVVVAPGRSATESTLHVAPAQTVGVAAYVGAERAPGDRWGAGCAAKFASRSMNTTQGLSAGQKPTDGRSNSGSAASSVGI